MNKVGYINIIGGIGSDAYAENSLRSVMEQVKAAGVVEKYIININSGGGEVAEGFAIYNYLLSLEKPIITRGVGMVASIATVIFLAGGKRELYPNTQFLIHNPWTFGEGDADVLEKKAEELRGIENQLLDFYVGHTGVEKTTLQSLMKEDKIIPADTAHELKFATEILQPVKAYATINNKNKTKETMSKIGKIFREAFTALKANGVVLNDMVQTTDGTELEIEMMEGSPSVGDMVTVNGEPANGTYELADGTTIIVTEGKITEVMKPEAAQNESVEDAEKKKMSNDVNAQLDALNEIIAQLEAENNALKAENSQMIAEVKTITNHLQKMKIAASVPTAQPQFSKSVPTSNELSKEEIKARFNELKAKSKKRNTIAH
jgi:ATP-dependent Clp protease protease subunit